MYMLFERTGGKVLCPSASLAIMGAALRGA